MKTRILVIGSGAGGAVTALELARAGYEVLVLEEGARRTLMDYGRPPTEAMKLLYRRRGMTPILGKVPIGYVEGQCVGGSTEINSGFWHRTPRESLLRWKSQYDLCDAQEADLDPHFQWAEDLLGVGMFQRPWPLGTQLFARGLEAMGWPYQEVPRAAPGCRNTNACASGCPTGAKQGMSRRIVPLAEEAGACFLPNCRVVMLLHNRGRVTGVLVRQRREDGSEQVVNIEADDIFVCCGPTETPALLLRSGIRYHVGNSLRIHPYLKVAAEFKQTVNADLSVLPLLQAKFSSDLSLGGSFFSTGHLAMTLNENWPQNRSKMKASQSMAQFYVGVRGTGLGSVRPTIMGEDCTLLRYELSETDIYNLSVGLARLATCLLSAGATAVYPSVFGIPSITSELDAVRWLDQCLPKSALSLVTVHAFSTCPSGERRDRCAVDSFGKVYGYQNLYLNDASILPDSPGVNPQGTIMALARRNAQYFTNKG